MVFSHENLDVYRVAIKYAHWVFVISKEMRGINRHARDQLLRASQSILLNIAEGNGKATEGDRRHFFEVARGSALECAATQDILEIYGAIGAEENAKAKDLLDRIVAMLTRMGGRGYVVKDFEPTYEGRTASESGSELAFEGSS